ncbi:T9SS type A sorting domain-containing protein [Algibacter amylolyticus]|uniref:T9SS type A sorting domain-containing protein n=1 Tax=Algibacter amylolyticus TaxID=1608400 RepID=A0A5M7B7Y3_9FLAO|nr:leucine-rich repeat domain-containing protein [Algibacter amylolyticus]KAA5823694.1 T9SS type A sorting domain-containing protein [Algibacter amylolyticus]MBB5267863.1 Leucine-rich repeat (LRR) protein [Algibacter amylolyticus]TSJ74182.1 T9SS type A sorting domain-containing protein [Algibacter amylolyticus]
MKKKYFLLKIILLVFSTPLFAQNAPVPTVEYQALVDFYNLMGGDDWRTKWDISSNNLHTTTWYGVVVENEHIVEISLPNNKVRGAIPASFSNLKFLRKLDLSATTTSSSYSHDLSSSNLENLSGLESLQDLNLRYCSISGSLPTSWSQLTELKSLIVSNNELADTIFNEIGNLTALESIDFSNNNLSAIPASISNLTNLKTINLRYNEITILPQELEDLTNLTHVYLEYNMINDIEGFLNTNIYLGINSQTVILDEIVYNGVDVILTNLPDITRYNRTSNDFSALNNFYLQIDGSNVATNIKMEADGSIVLSKSLLNTLTSEKQVRLYQQSGSAGGTYINFTTTTVDLPAIPDDEYQALVDFYNATQGDSSWITTWDVSVNNLNLGAWYGLAIEDGHIVEINLPNNRIIGAIPATFNNLKFLRTLNLSSTTTSSYYAHDFSSTNLDNLSGLESLEELNLRYCNISGSLPSSWSQLTNLKSLTLNNNALSGTIFSEIGNLTDMEEIDFSYNNLTGIPTSIANLTSLKTINLRNNEITILPQELEDLTNLTTLNVYYNQITDTEAFLTPSVNLSIYYQTITVDEFVYSGDNVVLTNLPDITRYNRANNDFSELNSFYLRINNSNVATNLGMEADGSLIIPKEYLSSLTPEQQVSIFQQNGTSYGTTINFTTTTLDLPAIPDDEYQALVDFYNATQGDSSWINTWDVSVNNLNLGAWYGLAIEDGHIVEINLPNNRIIGAIPATFSNLKFLRTLNLSSTSSSYYAHDFSSTNLDNLSGLESLEELNMRYCNISGSLPSSWSQLTNLKSLTLNNNALSGTIFSEIDNLTALEEVDFSYNNITAISTSIGNLTSLKTINLRNNEITILPQELEDLTNLTTLNVYYNQITDIEAFLTPSVNLSIYYQTITRDEFVYSGDDVVLTNLPDITRYNRANNDFSELNSFYLRINNSNVATNLGMEADGSLIIPKEYLSSLTPEQQVSIFQQNGTSYGTTINFTNTTLDLEEIPDEEYQALVDFYNATQGDSNWINQWDVSINNLNLGAWYGLAIEDGHIVEISLPNNRIVGAIPASFSNLKFLRKLDLSSTTTSSYYTHDFSSTDLNNLSGLESLEELNLRYCNISGPLPASWSQLTNLKSLSIRDNDITSIPAELDSLTNLEVLDLSYNSLENSEVNFSNLQLTTLNLRYQTINIENIEIESNEINIDLPTALIIDFNTGEVNTNASNEFQLFVNNVYQKTSFSSDGKLIFSNINLLNLEVTDNIRIYQTTGAAQYSNIYYNTLSFGLPLVDEEFEILKTLYNATNGDSWTNSWDISVNNVNTTSWFGVSIKGGHVVSINLFNNNLSGVIPADITGLSKLQILALNNNDLQGSIPTNISLLTDLETLDLSSNALSGNIPNTISDLQYLKKFAIGNNNFTGTVPSVLSDFVALEHLDISSNGFDNVEKKLYYDFTNTYIDLRNQVINFNTVLNLEGSELTVELGNVAKYDLENNNFDAKNTFVLLVNDVTHTSTITNDVGEIIFEDVRIGEIPSNAKISIRQTTGTFRNTEFNYEGIEDKSNIPVVEQEYLALVSLYNSLDGDDWTNSWDISTNNLHTNKWYGVSTYDGHIVAINLSANNVSNSVPNIFGDLPFLNTLNLSSNKLTSIDTALPATIDFVYDRQTIEAGDINLNSETTIKDFSINTYEHSKSSFNNQTYNLRIGSFSRTINLSETGIKLIDLIKTWKVPNNQKVELRQISGDAKNSIINYYLQYESGDSNLDSQLNVLDIQTSINHIINNYVPYFNFNAADVNSSNSINILDVIGQVNIIQNQEKEVTTKSALAKEKTHSATTSKISIENGFLYLDTNGHDVTSFEILINDTTKETIEELISPLGFSVNMANKNNSVNLIAYSFSSSLNGKIALAKLANTSASVQSVLLAGIDANEIPSEILENALSTNEFDIGKTSHTYNFPNPFKDETTIDFYLDNNRANTTLSIYDVRGRKVEEIVIKTLLKGNNQYLFKRKKLPSGIYFYLINTKGYNATLKGKMIIKDN